jgi:DNA-directed RNA polymerase specialized sigma24 family protein
MHNPVHTFDVVLPDPAEVVEQIDTRQRRREGVRAAMRSLTLIEREIAVQVFIHDRPVEAVAAELNLGTAETANTAFQVRQQLAGAFGSLL